MKRFVDKIEFPSDWNSVKLNDIGTVFKGKGVSKSEILESGLPCVRYGEIYTDYHFRFVETNSFISQESADNSRQIQFGDILLSGSGETPEEIGKAIAYVGTEEAYAGGDIVILRPSNPHDGDFLGYLLNSEYVNQQKYMVAQGHSVVHLYGKNVEELKVFLPPSEERKTIAAILRKWDELIEQQSKLIVAKELQKEGLVENLLTGTIRFPEFRSKWQTYGMGDAFVVARGGSPRPINSFITESEDGVNWVKIGDTTKGGKYIFSTRQKIITEGIKKSVQVVEDDFILSNSMSFGKPYIMKTSGCIHDGWLLLRKKIDCSIDFMYYMLGSQVVRKQYLRLAAGSAVKNLNKEIVCEVTLKLPERDEQDKIASVLSSLDREIEMLKSELESYRNQKKGLMQQLLTGKIRV